MGAMLGVSKDRFDYLISTILSMAQEWLEDALPTPWFLRRSTN